jgi:hypothetical protein
LIFRAITPVPPCPPVHLVEAHSSLHPLRHLPSAIVELLQFLPLSMYTSPDMKASGLRRLDCGGRKVLRISTFGLPLIAQEAHVSSESIPSRPSDRPIRRYPMAGRFSCWVSDHRGCRVPFDVMISGISSPRLQPMVSAIFIVGTFEMDGGMVVPFQTKYATCG